MPSASSAWIAAAARSVGGMSEAGCGAADFGAAACFAGACFAGACLVVAGREAGLWPAGAFLAVGLAALAAGRFDMGFTPFTLGAGLTLSVGGG